MTVNEVIEYLIDEVAAGRIDGNANLFGEYMEEVGTVEDFLVFENGDVHCVIEL